MITKRQAKIEALEIAATVCTGFDHAMWDELDEKAVKDQERILKALTELGIELSNRADRMKATDRANIFKKRGNIDEI